MTEEEFENYELALESYFQSINISLIIEGYSSLDDLILRLKS